MLQVWLFAFRACLATFYLTLIFANRPAAEKLILPMTIIAWVIAIHDLIQWQRGHNGHGKDESHRGVLSLTWRHSERKKRRG